MAHTIRFCAHYNGVKEVVFETEVSDEVFERMTPGLIFIAKTGVPMPPKFDEWQTETEQWCENHET